MLKKQDFDNLLTHSHNKNVLNAYYVSGPMPATGDIQWQGGFLPTHRQSHPEPFHLAHFSLLEQVEVTGIAPETQRGLKKQGSPEPQSPQCSPWTTPVFASLQANPRADPRHAAVTITDTSGPLSAQQANCP